MLRLNLNVKGGIKDIMYLTILFLNLECQNIVDNKILKKKDS